jgi:hydroxypyruvate isomerase
MTFALRYAAHLGFRSLDQPLFPASAGSADPLAQIAFAASIGFAGVQDPWFATRPPETQRAICEALQRYGLEAGCVVCGSPAGIRAPLWIAADVFARERLEAEVRAAVEAARRLGARHVAVLTGSDPARERAAQLDAMIGNLVRLAPIAEAEGVALCLEPTNARTLSGMLLTHFEEGLAVVREVASHVVKMIFDTAHIQSMDGDLIGRLERDWDVIALIQIANHPGRLEPAAGEIAMAEILRAVHRQGYRGLVELEHLWSEPGEACERNGLAWLAAFDRSLRQTREADPCG